MIAYWMESLGTHGKLKETRFLTHEMAKTTSAVARHLKQLWKPLILNLLRPMLNEFHLGISNGTISEVNTSFVLSRSPIGLIHITYEDEQCPHLKLFGLSIVCSDSFELLVL